MKSPIYWHPAIYSYVMKLLCSEGFEPKYERLRKEIGSSGVLDIGCGDCYLANYVSRSQYCGLDINRTFVKSAQHRGLDVRVFDIRTDPVPEHDIIILSNVLHQLYPAHEEILARIIKSARQKAIICEPTEHLAASPNRFIAWFARRMNDPGYGSPRTRLSSDELFALFRKHQVTSIDIIGREAVAVFEK